ncbi:MAG: PAS domain-containing protein, partial [Pseudomonadota bacterium]
MPEFGRRGRAFAALGLAAAAAPHPAAAAMGGAAEAAPWAAALALGVLCLALFRLYRRSEARLRAASTAGGRAEPPTALPMAVVEAMPVGFVQFDRLGRVKLSNARFREMIGWSGDGPFDGHVDYERLSGWARSRGAASSGQPHLMAWEGRRAAAAGPGGGYSEYVDQDGRAIACFDRIVGGGDLVGVRFDVTELRQKQRALEVAEAEIGETTAALRRETQRLRAISSFAPVGAWIYDFDEHWLTWDQATRAMFGVDDAFDPTPQAALRFLTPSAASELRRVAREATAEKRPFECLLEFKNAEGGRGWARIAGAPDADDAARFSGVVQDVTA